MPRTVRYRGHCRALLGVLIVSACGRTVGTGPDGGDAALASGGNAGRPGATEDSGDSDPAATGGSGGAAGGSGGTTTLRDASLGPDAGDGGTGGATAADSGTDPSPQGCASFCSAPRTCNATNVVCSCPPGLTGDDCTERVGDCSVSRLWCYDGTCNDGDLVPTCTCNGDLFGPRCSARVGLQLKSLDAGATVVCGIRMDDTLVCWGDQSLSKAPSGKFSKVAVSSLMSCAVAIDDGSLHCWGYEADKLVLPAGPFVDVGVRSYEEGCALTAEGKITCWGPHSGNAPREFENGGFSKLVSREDSLCAIRTDGALFCWPGYDSLEGNERYRDVSFGGLWPCAVRDDGSATCPTGELYSRPLPTGRTYVWAGAMQTRWCGLDTTGTLECTDTYSRTGDGFTLPGKYLSADTTLLPGRDTLCAIRDDHRVVCIGEPERIPILFAPLE